MSDPIELSVDVPSTTVERPAHVLHVIVGLDAAGAELALRRLVGVRWRGDTHRHSVISLTNMGPLGEELRREGVQVFALGLRPGLRACLRLFKLVAIIRRLDPDIVQTWMYHADLLGGLAARLVGKRTIIWGVRTTEITLSRWSATVVVRWMCARLSGVIPIAIVCAAEASLRKHVALGYDRGKMVVIPNGCDWSAMQSSSAERARLRHGLGLQRDRLVIGFVGRFCEDKDVRNFVRAAALVAREIQEARFLMVGRDVTAANPILGEWIEESGVPERFVLMGERSRVAECFACMDIFALSSRTEGLPNVVLEAMASGVPCVVTDVGDAPAVVGDCGVVVPKEDAAALAEGMKQLIALSPTAKEDLSRRSRERIRDAFSMERCVERFGSLYQSLLDRA